MEKPEISKIELESIYNAFISNPLQSILVIDPDFNILDFNEVALEKLKFLRVSPPKKGESFLNLVQAENLEKTKKDLELALLGTPVSGIKQLRGIKKGHSYSTQFGYTPLKDNRGSVICLVLAYQDVTAENLANTRAEQFSSLLDLLFEQSHEGLLVVDLSNLDFKANPEFYRIFDLDNHQLTEEVGRILAPGKWDFSFPFSVKQS
jgi:PAS domain-containing protein